MKWDEWNEIGFDWDTHFFSHLKPTNIECPKCGKYVKMRTDIVLTTYPAQYQYECECGWIGYSHARA